MIAYLQGEEGEDSLFIDICLEKRGLALPPAAYSELLSDPSASPFIETWLHDLPILALHDGYWRRVGAARRTLLQKRIKARLPDAMIAQSCIDHAVPLVTRDNDFRPFAEHCGLKLAVL